MVHPLLPPIKENSNIPSADSHGKWMDIGRLSSVAVIGAGLRLSGDGLSAARLASIPDVWAQAEVARHALTSDEHPMHREIVSQWRGLLGLFALASFYDYRLETVVLSLNDLRNSPFVGGTRQGPNKNFADVLNAVRPNVRLSHDANWDRLGVVLLNGFPSGMLVPSTLVCPARSVWKAEYANHVPWVVGGRLSDPLAVQNIRGEQLMSLADLASRLRRAVLNDADATDRPSRNLIGAVARQLELLEEDTRNEVERRGTSFANTNLIAGPHTSYRLPPEAIYRGLNEIRVARQDEGPRTELQIRMRSDRNADCKLVLCDVGISEQLGVSASDLRVWKFSSLQTLVDFPDRAKRIEDEMASEGYALVRASDLLTEKICELSGSRLVAHDSEDAKQCLLPITPLVHLIFTPDEIRKNLKVERLGDARGYRVHLTLPITAEASGDRFVTFERHYDRETNVITKEQPNALTSWPNFRADDWPWNFLFYDLSKKSNFVVRAPIEYHSLVTSLQDVTNLRQRVEAVRRLAKGEIGAGEFQDFSRGEFLIRIYKLRETAEAVVCEVYDDDGQKRATLAGSLLLPEVPEVRKNSRSYRIGIDFGTTNTAVYMRHGQDKPEPVIFRNRYVVPFETYSETELVNAHSQVLPFRDVPVPFMTVLWKDRVAGDQRLVLDHAIADVIAIQRVIDSLMKPDDILKFNLKWSKEEADRSLVTSFIAHVGMQAAAEAVATGATLSKIEWLFSHPEAFTARRLNEFKRSCSIALKKLSPDSVSSITHKTESLSSALYFSDTRLASFTETVVTIDIGGQTSDVSIWQAQRLLWRNSVEVAGRHMFTGYLAHHDEFFRLLSRGDSETAAGADRVDLLDSDKRLSGVEVIVNSGGFRRNFAENLLKLEGTAEGAGLRIAAEVMFAGLTSYIGMLFVYLRDKGLLEPALANRVRICVGGRASTLFSTLFPDEASLGLVLRALERRSGGIIGSAHVTFTRDPKHEVAYGLLVDEHGAQNLDTAARCRDTIAGEEVAVDGTMVSSAAVLHDLSPAQPWRVGSLKSIQAFVSDINDVAEFRIKWSDQLADNILQEANRSLADARQRIAQDRGDREEVGAEIVGEVTEVEPPFIVELRALLSALTTDLANAAYK